MLTSLLLPLPLFALAVQAPRPAAAPTAVEAFEFDAAAAEHLLNRAGFGATPEEARALAALGLQGAIQSLLEPRTVSQPFFAEPLYGWGPRWERALAHLPETDDSEEAREARRDLRGRFRRIDRLQMSRYTQFWLRRMLRAEDPLRDRMALFWHGYFTSSFEDVRNSYELITQARFLREGALGGFDVLLEGIARDPAMLEYLDNDSNRVREPNENFARELMELFTLGEGYYEESDVVDAARAFTGWRDEDGEFEISERHHDDGPKRFLGREGNLGGEEVLAALLEERQTARHLAGRLLTYFEGAAPAPERLENYAAVLRGSGWRISALLARLFSDPQFYRDEVVGQRIASPLDFLVGLARRLGIEPPPRLIEVALRQLDQHLFHPPNVKGWDEGRAWITTASLIRRVNLAGVWLGRVQAAELLGRGTRAEMGAEFGGEAMEGDLLTGSVFEERSDRVVRALESLDELQWGPEYHLTARLGDVGTGGDRAVVEALGDLLLARPLELGSLPELVHTLSRLRAELDLPEPGFLAAGPDAEHVLRELAHAILSGPEAQLH